MRSVSPVIHLESSEAKKTAAGVMSSVWPTRPSGVCDSNIFRMSPSELPRAKFLRQGWRDGVHCALGGVVNHASRRSQRAGKRTDIDHAAAFRTKVLQPLLRRQHHT